MSSKYDFIDKKERFIKAFLFIVIIILLFINFILVKDKNNIINNDEKVIASLEDNVNRNSVLNFEYDNNTFDFPPNKEEYEIESISCDNALGGWNEKEWELELSDIKGKIRCNILFRKKIKTFSSMNSKKTAKKKNKTKKIILDNNKIEDEKKLNEQQESLNVSLIEDNKTLETESNKIVKQNDDDIVNNIYQIKTIDNIKYIIGFEPKTKINDIISTFKNKMDSLYFYDKNNNLVTDYEKIITTGMTIKLQKEDNSLDQTIIIIRGDINKDGIVNVNDYKKLNKYLANLLQFDFDEKKAADVDYNEIIDNNDYEKLSNYISKLIPSLN